MPGEKFEAKIVLKILSDVGVVGKPSAGKSTFLNAISNLYKSSWIWIHYPSTTIGNGSVSWSFIYCCRFTRSN
ncbi:GTPase [Mycoplasmopsis cynos]|uniref:GTPase domain-containing protein n=1 Tax=Mycoplasmopsis cynos TaxID=171284 RepID=UPI003A5C81F9